MNKFNIRSVMIIFIATFITIFPTISIAQPKDIDGWRNAKWGMTPEEVIKIFADNGAYITQHNKGQQAIINVKIDNYKLGKNDFKVTFLFDKTDKGLKNIYIQPKDSVIEGSKGPALVEELRLLLVEKYGPMTDSTENHSSTALPDSGMFVNIWQFPSTKIELIRTTKIFKEWHMISIAFSQKRDSGI